MKVDRLQNWVKPDPLCLATPCLQHVHTCKKISKHISQAAQTGLDGSTVHILLSKTPEMQSATFPTLVDRLVHMHAASLV